MAKQIFSTILIGILLGVVIFMAPFFLLKIFIFFLLIGAICRLWWGGRRGGWKGRGWGGYHYAYADKIRNMNEEEYKAFKEKMDSSCGGYYGCGSYYNNDSCWGWDKNEKKTDSKNETSNNQ